MYRVYILVNADGKRYIGLSENVSKRLADHNSGISKWTAKHGPWALQWVSQEFSLSEARWLESKMKRQKGGVGLHTLMKRFGQTSGS